MYITPEVWTHSEENLDLVCMCTKGLKCTCACVWECVCCCCWWWKDGLKVTASSAIQLHRGAKWMWTERAAFSQQASKWSVNTLSRHSAVSLNSCSELHPIYQNPSILNPSVVTHQLQWSLMRWKCPLRTVLQELITQSDGDSILTVRQNITWPYYLVTLE